MLKRFLDLAAVILLAPLWLPLLGVVALAVRWKLGSPVLFRQVRPGLHGRPFAILKFRTMIDVVDEHGIDLCDWERITPFGQWLRSTSLDELPSILNLARGDVTLVGPRPLLTEYLPLYSPEQARRHDVRPGLTGWTQVNGRNNLDWDEKFRLDTWYVDNRSTLLDLRILLMTVGKVLKRDGIRGEGSPSAPRFRGSAR